MARSEEGANESGDGGAASDPIDQVRELLFGAPKRETIDRIGVLEGGIEEMRADFLARLSALESRMSDLARDGGDRQMAAYEAIGGAIVQLGVTIQFMGARRRDG